MLTNQMSRSSEPVGITEPNQLSDSLIPESSDQLLTFTKQRAKTRWRSRRHRNKSIPDASKFSTSFMSASQLTQPTAGSQAKLGMFDRVDPYLMKTHNRERFDTMPNLSASFSNKTYQESFDSIINRKYTS